MVIFSEYMRLILPLPTAINATYKTGNGKFYKSDEATKWEYLAKQAIRKQHKHAPVGSPVCVGLEFFIKRDRDIDSGIKIVLDALQREGVVENDKLIEHLNVKKYKIKEFGGEPRVEIDMEVL